MSAWVVSKRHIDILVQSAIVGATDSERDWLHVGQDFSYWHDGARHKVTYKNASEVGQMLWNENHYSVDYRYSPMGRGKYAEMIEGKLRAAGWEAGDETSELPAVDMVPPGYCFSPTGRGTNGLTPLVTLAELACGVACYEYQSCEHDGWETSAAHAFCRALKDHMLAHLPGFEAAPWGWS